MSRRMLRRDCLRLLGGAALLPHLSLRAQTQRVASSHPNTPAGATLTPADEAFLNEMQRRACLYFVEQASPANGQVLDRAKNFSGNGSPASGRIDPRRMASIAATGFGLSALCIAEHRGFQPRAAVLGQVRRTLRFHVNTLPNVHGFFYHFNDIVTGAHFRDVEVSSIDTALLLCGVLTARAHFSEDAEIHSLATTIYNRVDWPWMLNGGQTFDMGWKPESGFLKARWNHYCELMMMYLLALGSPTHPIEPACWDAWTRPIMHYDGFTYISAADPLFVHQYSQAWFDFRHKRDKYADYFANSITATRAHEAFCLNLGPPYSPDYWGISASDSQHGYTAWGGPASHKPDPIPAEIAQGSGGSARGLRGSARGFGDIDGSVVPYATAGSLPFLPAACLRVQRSLYANYRKQAWGRYGFCDAFHPQADWYDPDVLGIDLGISVLMAENLRTGFLWSTFARNPEVPIAFQRAGFHTT